MARWFVTRHARNRFALRVNAVDDPVHSILHMWHCGRPASNDDLSLFRVEPDGLSTYRVGQNNGFYCLMVERNNCIVTVLTQ